MQSVRFRDERSVIKRVSAPLFRKKKELKFNEFNLSAELLAEIRKSYFVEASPIQEQTILWLLKEKMLLVRRKQEPVKRSLLVFQLWRRLMSIILWSALLRLQRVSWRFKVRRTLPFWRKRRVLKLPVYGGSLLKSKSKPQSGAHIVVGTPDAFIDLTCCKALKT